MPKLGKKHYPYTKAGYAAYAKAVAKKKKKVIKWERAKRPPPMNKSFDWIPKIDLKRVKNNDQFEIP